MRMSSIRRKRKASNDNDNNNGNENPDATVPSIHQEEGSMAFDNYTSDPFTYEFDEEPVPIFISSVKTKGKSSKQTSDNESKKKKRGGGGVGKGTYKAAVGLASKPVDREDDVEYGKAELIQYDPFGGCRAVYTTPHTYGHLPSTTSTAAARLKAAGKQASSSSKSKAPVERKSADDRTMRESQLAQYGLQMGEDLSDDDAHNPKAKKKRSISKQSNKTASQKKATATAVSKGKRCKGKGTKQPSKKVTKKGGGKDKYAEDTSKSDEAVSESDVELDINDLVAEKSSTATKNVAKAAKKITAKGRWSRTLPDEHAERDDEEEQGRADNDADADAGDKARRAVRDEAEEEDAGNYMGNGERSLNNHKHEKISAVIEKDVDQETMGEKVTAEEEEDRMDMGMDMEIDMNKDIFDGVSKEMVLDELPTVEPDTLPSAPPPPSEKLYQHTHTRALQTVATFTSKTASDTMNSSTTATTASGEKTRILKRNSKHTHLHIDVNSTAQSAAQTTTVEKPQHQHQQANVVEEAAEDELRVPQLTGIGGGPAAEDFIKQLRDNIDESNVSEHMHHHHGVGRINEDLDSDAASEAPHDFGTDSRMRTSTRMLPPLHSPFASQSTSQDMSDSQLNNGFVDTYKQIQIRHRERMEECYNDLKQQAEDAEKIGSAAILRITSKMHKQGKTYDIEKVRVQCKKIITEAGNAYTAFNAGTQQRYVRWQKAYQAALQQLSRLSGSYALPRVPSVILDMSSAAKQRIVQHVAKLI